MKFFSPDLPIIRYAFETLEKINNKKIDPSIYSCHTLKPFDHKKVKQIEKKYKKIITLEDHSTIGGLGSMCREIFSNKKKLKSFSLTDKFIHNFHDQNHLLKLHKIDYTSISKAILQ